MKSVNPDATRDVVAESDLNLPPSEQTVWEINQPTDEEFAYLQDLSGAPGTQTLACLHLCLGAARHFFDPQGNPVVFRRDESKRAIVGRKKPWMSPILTYIPPKERDRLAALIYKGVGVEEAEAKNS